MSSEVYVPQYIKSKMFIFIYQMLRNCYNCIYSLTMLTMNMLKDELNIMIIL